MRVRFRSAHNRLGTSRGAVIINCVVRARTAGGGVRCVTRDTNCTNAFFTFKMSFGFTGTRKCNSIDAHRSIMACLDADFHKIRECWTALCSGL